MGRILFGNKSVAISWVVDENDGLDLGSLEVFGAVLLLPDFLIQKRCVKSEFRAFCLYGRSA